MLTVVLTSFRPQNYFWFHLLCHFQPFLCCMLYDCVDSSLRLLLVSENQKQMPCSRFRIHEWTSLTTWICSSTLNRRFKELRPGNIITTDFVICVRRFVIYFFEVVFSCTVLCVLATLRALRCGEFRRTQLIVCYLSESLFN